MDEARKNARVAMQAIGLDLNEQRLEFTGAPGFGALFPLVNHSPNAIERAAAEGTSADERLVIVEGEPPAAALVSYGANEKGLTPVSWRGGAGKEEVAAWDRVKGRSVILWPDLDSQEQGLRAMETAARRADAAGATSLYMVELSEMPDTGKDGADAADVDSDTALSLLQNAPPYEIPDQASSAVPERAEQFGPKADMEFASPRALSATANAIRLLMLCPEEVMVALNGEGEATLRVCESETGLWRRSALAKGVVIEQSMERWERDALTNAGYAPVLTGDPEEALSLVEANDPHLVLLDLMLPGTDGIELIRGILDMADVPVIFLSAYGQEETIARAFEKGADDYVVKPFSPMELVARIKAALHKREAPEWAEPSEPFVLGELAIDYAERRVTLAGRPVQLTAIEYGLLFELSVNAGRVLTYDRLLRRVWGLRRSGDSRRVRTAAKQLRRKLGDDANNPTYILNEPRVGYRMAKGTVSVPTGGKKHFDSLVMREPARAKD